MSAVIESLDGYLVLARNHIVGFKLVDNHDSIDSHYYGSVAEVHALTSAGGQFCIAKFWAAVCDGTGKGVRGEHREFLSDEEWLKFGSQQERNAATQQAARAAFEEYKAMLTDEGGM